MAVSHGLNVVRPGWLDESLKVGRLVSEECYDEYEKAPSSYTP